MNDIDFLTVFFASIIYFVMYIVWYSKFLFGKFYNGLIKKQPKNAFFYYVLIFIFVFIISYIIALFEILLGITTFWDGVFLGLLVWFGFVATHSLFSVISFKRSLKLCIIDNILYLLGLMIISGILAG